MTSVAPITSDWSFQASRLGAPDKVNASRLDSEFYSVQAKVNEILTALQTSIRDDNTLVDELVRLRNLHPEVFTALDARTNALISQALLDYYNSAVQKTEVSTSASAGMIPRALGTGKLDYSWFPTIYAVVAWGGITGNLTDQTEFKATPTASKVPIADVSGKLDAWVTASGPAATASLRTLGTSATSACAGNDSRLSDARTPTSHNLSHRAGGSDALSPLVLQLSGAGTYTQNASADTLLVGGTYTTIQLEHFYTIGHTGAARLTIKNITASDMTVLPPPNVSGPYGSGAQYTIEGEPDAILPAGGSFTIENTSAGTMVYDDGETQYFLYTYDLKVV